MSFVRVQWQTVFLGCFLTLKDKLSCTTWVEWKTITNWTRIDVITHWFPNLGLMKWFIDLVDNSFLLGFIMSKKSFVILCSNGNSNTQHLMFFWHDKIQKQRVFTESMNYNIRTHRCLFSMCAVLLLINTSF